MRKGAIRGRWLMLLVVVLLGLSGCSSLEGHVGAGEDLDLEPGQVYGDIALYGGDLFVPTTARVDGKVALFGGDATIDGDVNGDLASFGGDVQLNGSITGDVALVGGDLSGSGTVSGDVAVNGGTNYLNGGDSATPPESDSGDFDFADRPEPTFGERVLGFIGSVVWGIVKAIAFGAMGMMLALFMPEPLLRTRRAIRRAPLPSMGLGFVAWPVVGIVALFLGLTIIGIPVAALVVIAMMVVSLLGWLALGSLFGERLLRGANVRRPQLAAAAAIGAASLSLMTSVIGAIPFFGWLIVGLASCWGIGAAILTYGGTREYAAPRPVPVGAAPYSVPPSYSPPTNAPPYRHARDLYADLAADLGLDEDDLRGGPRGPETPVYPPDDKG